MPGIDDKDLLPCPFCGGEPSVSTHQDESLWSRNIVTKTTVTCVECDISFETEPGYEFEAPEAWNRRAPLAAKAPPGEAVAWRMLKPDGELHCFWHTNPLSKEALEAGYTAQPLYASPAPLPDATAGGVARFSDDDVAFLNKEWFAAGYEKGKADALVPAGGVEAVREAGEFGGPPPGYHPLPEGAACRCPKLWQDGKGNHWCCRPVSASAPASEGKG